MSRVQNPSLTRMSVGRFPFGGTGPRSSSGLFGDSGDGYGVRSAEVVALPVLPTLRSQDVGLHPGLDTFRDAGQVHAVDQTAQTPSEVVGLAVAGGEVVHESQVELDPRHRQVSQHRHGGVPGAEVVEVDADPEPAQDARATWAESTRLRTAVSVTSITTRAGSTRCRARVSRTFLSQPVAASWSAETLTLIGPGS